MPMFRVVSTEACWVEFSYEVRAANADEAKEAVCDGQADCVGTEIPDRVDGYEAEYEVCEL